MIWVILPAYNEGILVARTLAKDRRGHAQSLHRLSPGRDR